MRKIAVIALSSLSLLLTACPGPDQSPFYSIFIYYKNDKGEDLLDQNVSGHFIASEVKVNAGGTDSSIQNLNANAAPLPAGYALSFNLPKQGNFKDIITLSSNVTDTLLSTYSGTTLVSCTYNSMNVLPATMATRLLPVVIVK